MSLRNRVGSLLLIVAAACGNGARVDEDKVNTRLDLCADQLAKREYESAETECGKALAMSPREHRAHNYLGLIDFVRASDMHTLVEIDDCLTGVDAEGLLQKKDDYLVAARARLTRAVELRPDYGEAWSNLCAVSLLLDEHDRAETECTHALENAAQLANPSTTRTNLAWALFHSGRLPEAAAELRQALRFEPEMCVAHYRLGRVYFARKEWDKALFEFEKVASQPEACRIQEAHLFLMKTYVETGLAANLPRALEGCLSLSPKSCIAAQCRAMVP